MLCYCSRDLCQTYMTNCLPVNSHKIRPNAVDWSLNMLEVYNVFNEHRYIVSFSEMQKCTVSTRSLQRLLLKSLACVPLSVCQRSGQRWGEVHDPEWLCPAVSGTAHSDPPQPQNCAAHRRRRWHHKGRVRVKYDYHHLAIHHRYMSNSCRKVNVTIR